MFLKERWKTYIKLSAIKKENLQKRVETIPALNLTNFGQKREIPGFQLRIQLDF